MIFTSRPSSLKNPSSRATSSGRSWMAFIMDAVTVLRFPATALICFPSNFGLAFFQLARSWQSGLMLSNSHSLLNDANSASMFCEVKDMDFRSLLEFAVVAEELHFG